MASIPEAIRDRIKANAPVSNLLTGGVYLRAISRDKTPLVFRRVGQDPNDLSQIHYSPAISIRDPFYGTHPFASSRKTAYSAIQANHLYVESNGTEKAKLRLLLGMLVILFDDWYVDTDYGTKAFFSFYGADPIIEAEEFRGASKLILRFNIDGAFNPNPE